MPRRRWFRSGATEGSLPFPTELKTAKARCADRKLSLPFITPKQGKRRGRRGRERRQPLSHTWWFVALETLADVVHCLSVWKAVPWGTGNYGLVRRGGLMCSLQPFLPGKRIGKSFPQLKSKHWLENPKCLNWNYVPLHMWSSST